MDIGYHFDLSDTVLRKEGFSELAIKVAQFGSGMNDALGNVPDKWLNNFVVGPMLTEARFVSAMMLHADNLFTLDQVTRYWKQFLGNLQRELQAAEIAYTGTDKGPAVARALIAVGIAFHVLQDMCSHSTWCELFKAVDAADLTKADKPWRSRILRYRARSIFTKGNDVFDQALNELRTDRYGTYYTEGDVDEQVFKKWVKIDDARKAFPHNTDDHPEAPINVGQNLDHQDRRIRKGNQHADGSATTPPYGDRETAWDEAYVTALASSQHLLAQVKAWVGAAFLAALREPDRSLFDEGALEDLDDRMDTVRRLFLYIRFGHDDGHWKGPGSGSLVPFLGNALAFVSDYLNAVNRLTRKRPGGPPGGGADVFMDSLFALLDPDALPYRLYDKEDMGKETGAGARFAVISVDPPPVEFSVLTITVRSATVRTDRDFDGRGSQLVSVNGTLNPELYVQATCRNRDGGNQAVAKNAEQTYRDRTLETKFFDDQEVFGTDPKSFGGEPWQVVHFVPAGTRFVVCTLELFHDDRSGTGGHNQLRLSRGPGDARGVTFTVDLAATPKAVISDSVSGHFGLDLKLEQSDGSSTRFRADGEGGPHPWAWTATMEFSVTHATIEPPT